MKWIRPCTVIPMLALTVQYPSAAILFYHMSLGFFGGLFIEWLAIRITRGYHRDHL